MLDSETAKVTFPEGFHLLECMRLDVGNPNRLDFNSQHITGKFPQEFYFSHVLLFILTLLWDANSLIHV